MTGRLARLGGGIGIVDLFRARPGFAHLDAKTDFGATGDGVTDDQTALSNALAAAKAQGLPLYLPPGRYLHSGQLTADSVAVFGLDPRATELHGTTVGAQAVNLTGTGAGLLNVTVRGTGPSPRTSDRPDNGIYINNATAPAVRGCLVRDVPGAGIMTERSSGGLIQGCQVQDTGADGIYTTAGSHDIEIAYNLTVSTGDDAISVASYSDGTGICHDIQVHHNAVIGNWQSRAISVNGTSGGIVIHDNHIDGGTAGISVTSVAAWQTSQSTGVEAYGNTVRNINQARQDTGTIGGGALHVYNDLGGSDSGISMHDNRVYAPGLHGMYAAGTSPIAATFTDNAFYLDAGLILSASDNPSAVLTETGTTTGLPAAYPGDLVAATIGALELAFRYTPA